MEENKFKIEAETPQSKPNTHRSKKTSRKMELLKKSLRAYQYIAPQKVARIIWSYFTKPNRARFKEKHELLIQKAVTGTINYRNLKIVHYTWGTGDRRVLLCHGWNSKIADFRRMIEHLVDAGYTVEGIDMPAHGKSEGTHTALPEYRDILKEHCIKNGPYHAIVGYSLGGIAAGIVQSELDKQHRSTNLFIIAAPPYVRYFFADIVKKELKLSDKVYQIFCGLIEKYYHQSVDYFDLRTKTEQLKSTNIHLIYDENDDTVPFGKGLEMRKAFPESNWVHTKGLGHYKIIAHDQVIDYISKMISSQEMVENLE